MRRTLLVLLAAFVAVWFCLTALQDHIMAHGRAGIEEGRR